MLRRWPRTQPEGSRFSSASSARGASNRLWLPRDIRGQQVEIGGAGGRDFMVCLSYDGGQTTITQNGRHEGIRVGDIVFDNLHPNGMPFDQWIGDFDAIGGEVVRCTIDF